MRGVRPKGTDRSPWKHWLIRAGAAESAPPPLITDGLDLQGAPVEETRTILRPQLFF